LLIFIVAGVGLLPMLTGSASLREDLFLILLLVILASSLNIIMGYTGYVSFGHIVFYGLGGYFAFYLMMNLRLHFVLAALAGGVFTALLAALLGSAVLRLRGAYFALATIGINEAVKTFVANFEPFGGSTGMYFHFSLYDAYGGALNALWYAYYAILVVALVTLTASYLVKNSKFGLGLMAIREDQDAAQVLGINTTRYKILSFMLSALFPGVAGAIFFFKNGNIEPAPAFHLTTSIEGLVIVMLGGIGTVSGPVLGTVIYERLRAYLLTNEPFSSLHLAIAGVLLLIIVLFVTTGIVGWLRQTIPPLRRYLL
jgi:branched-chain amino acid transport system permease protein